MVIKMNKTLVIDRTKWRRGSQSRQKHGPVCLLSADALMCCLGFRCLLEPDIIDDDIFNIVMPGEVVAITSGVLVSAGVPRLSSKFSIVASMINDDETITDTQREQKLIKLAADIGEDWSFIN